MKLDRSTRSFRHAMIGGCVLLMSGTALSAPSALYSVNQLLGVPVSPTLLNVTLDGNEGSEWTGATKYLVEDGAPSSLGTIRMMSDSAFVYLYAEMQDQSPADDLDALVIAFSSSNSMAAGDYKRLVIKPCLLQGGNVCGGAGPFNPTITPATGTRSAANQVAWTAGASSSTGNLASGPLAGVEAKSNYTAGAPGQWRLEVKIPRALFPADYFGLYTNLLSFQAAGTVTQASWPPGDAITGGIMGTLSSIDIPLTRWGNAILGSAGFAPNLQITGFGSNSTDPSKVQLDTANHLYTTVTNVAGTGAGTVNAVNVTYKVANFGLSAANQWTPIPTPGPVPTPPPPYVPNGTGKTSAQQLLVGTSYVFNSGAWTPDATTPNFQGSGKTERAFYAANPHQCIWVEVFGSTANATTKLAQRQYNMDFPVSGQMARAQMNGGEWFAQFPEAQMLLLKEEFRNVPANFRWPTKIEGGVRQPDGSWKVRTLPGRSIDVGVAVPRFPTVARPGLTRTFDPAQLARGEAIRLVVTPGSILTLVTSGSARLNGVVVGPEGILRADRLTVAPGIERRLAVPPRAAPQMLRSTTLPRSATLARNVAPLTPATRVAQNTRVVLKDVLRPAAPINPGALIGSFDGWKSSFVIGSALSVAVPTTARALEVRMADGAPVNAGSMTLRATSTPLTASLNRTFLADWKDRRAPKVVPFGANLPMQIVRGYLDTGKTLTIKDKSYAVRIPVGSFGHYLVDK